MKKLITIILILAMLLPAAALADLPDLSAMSADELSELNRLLQIELFKKESAVNGVHVPAGIYTIGKDIPAGAYTIVFDNSDEWATCYFYLYSEDGLPIFEMGMGFSNSKQIGKLELTEGNRIELDNELVFYTYTGIFK